MHATYAVPLATQSTEGHQRRPLFKTDYPRTIDRYIDYFEGTATVDDGDACGETLLDRLA